MAKKSKGINPELEKSVMDLLKATMTDPAATLIEKTRVIDRAIALEKIKQKIEDDTWGTGFLHGDEADE